MIDRNTVVVDVDPDLSRQDFAGILREMGSPAFPEADTCHDAVIRYRVSPAFALAVFGEESTFATNPNAVVVAYQTFNPGNTRSSRTGRYPLVDVPGKGAYVKFPSWAAGFADLAARLVDPDFFYVQEGRRTIGQIIPRWAPKSDNNDPDAYIANVVARMNRWGADAPKEEQPPMPDAITFGNVKHPPFVERLIPDAENAAWDDLGQRVPVGVCQHSMVGSLWGTDGWFRRGRQSTGLTDYGIGGATDGPQWDGVILRWNDPRGRRSGWANGGSNGLEGDGPLFVRTYGVAGINRNLVSIERSDGGDIGTPMSPKQFESICQLSAYWFDWAKVPWDRFPLNPARECVTHLLHLEFATKTCPHPPVTNEIDRIQDRIRAILKAGQTAGGGPSVPPPGPIEPDHGNWAPYGWEPFKARFGDVRRHNPDGTVEQFFADPKGIITNTWFQRAKAEGLPLNQVPTPADWWVLDSEFTDRIDIIASDGSIWVLEGHAGNDGFRWVK